MENSLQLYNTLSGKKEPFEPIKPPFVGLYVCGPTVYSNAHLGNGRTFLSFDLINRYLRHLGYRVRYVRNITDVGHITTDVDEGVDRIGEQARLEQLEPMEIVQKYTLDFHEIMANLNLLPPDIEPTATGHMIEQIEMIKTILEKGFAYESDGNIYFDVQAYKEKYNYGELSGRNVEELFSNTRTLDGQSEKRFFADFALWKKASPEHIMRWPSPWGLGFPGWHLECSSMSTKYLGEQFDIHGGGMDLKFPHHESEVAQNTACSGHGPAKYWVHTNMLTFEGSKMSKSLGNSILPNELFTGDHPLLKRGFHPMVVRFFMLQAHYRSTLDFSNDALEAAEKGYQRLMAGVKILGALPVSDSSDVDVAGLKAKCYAAMNDDFNSPVLIGNLFDAVKMINSTAEGRLKITAVDKASLQELVRAFVDEVLGLKGIEDTSDGGMIEGLMDLILDVRARARANKDWGTSDAIRDQLVDLKIVVKDGKEGATWEVKA
ncbi:MAG: cysteine--tRNA ligase [Flavobacteriales bacterium]|nr:cysteine--tRNA ligase [Flavobacteriales bacterium]